MTAGSIPAGPIMARKKNKLYWAIAYSPDIALLFGDIPAAIFFTQLWYWSGKGIRKDGYIYKSKEAIERETGLTRRQQDRIRPLLERFGAISVKKLMANGHPTLHYKVLVDANVLISTFRNYPLVRNVLMDKHLSYLSITKITAKITAKSLVLNSTSTAGAVL
jgi:hypothetical protein